MDIFEKIKKIACSHTNEYLEQEITKGKKAIGYFCSYFPEEIVHAAGFIPYRMNAVASDGTSKGDIYYSSLNCTFVRRCFDKMLNEDFQFLDGVVFMNSCDHIRRMYDNARYAKIEIPFLYMFITPHLMNDIALERYRREIKIFKQEFEKHYQSVITDDALSESIELYNKKRSLMEKLYETRKQKILSIKGSELLNISLATSMMPVEPAIDLLEQVIEKIKDRKVSSDNDLRIYLASGCMEESAHIEMIEESGGAIVADSICLGQRYLDMQTDTSAPPVDALAQRYLMHMSCPRMMDDFKRRINFMNDSRVEYSVDAVIAEKLKFCDLWGGETYLHKQEAKKHGFPILALEREMYGSGEGQLRTRVQAFFEQVKNLKAQNNVLTRLKK